ncbi:heme NO-binding domain-containing protein [Paracoccus sp. JM45]|uniref:heme NO-binding domain-containing protein n=1 Tax=Paracoccus sp. JM45 TaxID=2283626 RepID=UPI000E6C1C1F|nr:heme NO-binding domain-containing protein [Paracoccus sp. JM45]RJE80124.1 heme NO-binding protein [Paracoccus sp. JM45]
MNSLINRGIEEFLRTTYGDTLVQAVAQDTHSHSGMVAPLGAGFGLSALHRAAMRLCKPFTELVEDMGAWMTRIEPVRRLLRFSGRDFKDFLLRLEELPGRAHLVLPSLQLPRLQIDAVDDSVWVKMLDPDDHWRFVLVGLIRGMADDYGALCLISTVDQLIRIDIWDEKFSEGRMFTLYNTAG